MYVITIKNGGFSTVIHEWWPSEVKVDSATISQERNAIDSLTFDIFPDNPGWGEINPFKTLVEVLNTKTNEIEFEGRVISPVPSMASDGSVALNVTCEGPMGYLNDSRQEYVEEQHYGDSEGHTGLYNFIAKLLEVHNSKVEDYKKIYPGDITLQTFATSSGVTKAISRDSTWNNLNDKLLGSFGGEMRVRRGTDGKLYLDYAEALGTTRATAVELGRNMFDAERAPDPSAVITRLYPYGCKLTEEVEDEDGNVTEVETEKRLDISSVNGGLKYIDDQVAIEKFGIIEGSMEWDDITVANNLLSTAQEWLGDNNSIPISTTVSALDLSLLGLDYDSFNLFDSYPIRNALIDLDETAEIVKKTVNINNPAESTFEFGETTARLSIDISASGSIQQQITEMQSQTNSAIVNLVNRIVETNARIEVLTDGISSTVSQLVSETIEVDVLPAISDVSSSTQTAITEGLGEISGLVSGLENDLIALNEVVTTNKVNLTNLLQTIEGWDFTWADITETVTQIGDQVYTEREERLKYIRFIDGEIWLGRDPDPGEDDFKVVISNERIRFLQNNVEVAYISNNQLYITNANVTNRLDIGNFYFAPRSNGNTTLRFNG